MHTQEALVTAGVALANFCGKASVSAKVHMSLKKCMFISPKLPFKKAYSDRASQKWVIKCSLLSFTGVNWKRLALI